MAHRSLLAGAAIGVCVAAPDRVRADQPDPHHHHHVPYGVLEALPPGPSLGGPGARHGTPVYENLVSTGFRYTLGNQMIADDLHMISGGPMTSFTFRYAGSSAFCGGFWGGVATIRFYENNATNTLLPGPTTLLASYSVPINGSGQSSYLRHFDVPTPVSLPQDIWMGISFGSGVIGGSGAVTASGTPTVGTSLNAHFTEPGGYVSAPHGFAYANYNFGVYVVPSPGSTTVLALGLLARCRRRSARAA